MTVEIQEHTQGQVKPLSSFKECENRRKRLINFFTEKKGEWITMDTIMDIQELKNTPKRTLRNDLTFLKNKEFITMNSSIKDTRMVIYKWKGGK